VIGGVGLGFRCVVYYYLVCDGHPGDKLITSQIGRSHLLSFYLSSFPIGSCMSERLLIRKIRGRRRFNINHLFVLLIVEVKVTCERFMTSPKNRFSDLSRKDCAERSTTKRRNM
jgi:hypothetical protein